MKFLLALFCFWSMSAISAIKNKDYDKAIWLIRLMQSLSFLFAIMLLTHEYLFA